MLRRPTSSQPSRVALADGPTGTPWRISLTDSPTTIVTVCGTSALGLVGLHIYSIVEELNNVGGSFSGIRKAEVVAEGLESMLWEAGSFFGFAFAVYLLAPSARTVEESATEPAA